LTYEWDLDNDGVYETAGGPTIDITFDDDGAYFVGVKVMDPYGFAHTAIAEVTVLNVAPTVDAGLDTNIISGETYFVNATFTDPGILDTHSATIDFGTSSGAEPGVVGQGAGFGTVSGSHQYLVPGLYKVEVCVTDDEGDQGCSTLTLTIDPYPVVIDIKPGGTSNPINLKSKGKVPVAVITTEDFDATIVDPITVLFAGASPTKWSWEDIDRDGDLDLMLHFKTQELSELDGDSTQATLTAETLYGVTVEGSDTVKIVPKKKP
jgi:hypothetical protein